MSIFNSNLLSALRMNNIFGAPNNLSSEAPRADIDSNITTRQLEDDYNSSRYMPKLYQPETSSIDKFNDMINNMPVRNKPGLGRKILAGIGAFGTNGPENVDNILYSPYYQGLADWSTKIKPVESAANLERQNNNNLRMLANQIVSQEMSDKRLGRQISRDNILEQQGQEKIKQGDARIAQGEESQRIANERLKIAEAVAKGGTFHVDDAGNAFFAFRDGSKASVNAQYLSAEQKNSLKANEAAAVTTARIKAGGGPKDRIVTQDIEDPNNPGKNIKIRINLDTGEAKPVTMETSSGNITTISKPSTAQEKAKALAIRAQQVKNSHPEWSRYIKIDKQGKVNIDDPGYSIGSSNIFGPSKATYDAINKSINGDSPVAKTKTLDPLKSGYVRIKDPNGVIVGQIPVTNVSQIPKGYSIVKEGN